MSMQPPKPTDSQKMRIEQMFREAFGRELTLAERRYLGLSAALDDSEMESLDQTKHTFPQVAGE